MARIELYDNTLSIISSYSVEDINKAKVICPDCLALKGDDGDAYYRVDTSDIGHVNKFGVVFDHNKAETGTAVCYLHLPTGLAKEDIASYVVDTIGGIANLTAVERQIETALNEYNARVETVSTLLNINNENN